MFAQSLELNALRFYKSHGAYSGDMHDRIMQSQIPIPPGESGTFKMLGLAEWFWRFTPGKQTQTVYLGIESKRKSGPRMKGLELSPSLFLGLVSEEGAE